VSDWQEVQRWSPGAEAAKNITFEAEKREKKLSVLLNTYKNANTVALSLLWGERYLPSVPSLDPPL